MNKRIWATLIVATLLGIAMVGLRHIKNLDNQIQLKRIQIKDNDLQLKIYDQKLDEVNKKLEEKTINAQEAEQQRKKIEEDNKKLQEQLQAKLKQKEQDIAAKAQQAAVAAVVPQKAYAASGNFYKDYIYRMESGNRTTAVNSIGCRGLGQACPGTKLPCGDDYACQDAYFTNYAMQRYGSWEAAYNFWLRNHWW
jgi:flagellar biosynthesis GTPase FlhF